MLPHPLTNFEMQKNDQKEPKSEGVYLKNNIPKIKDETYVINLDEYKSITTHLIVLYVNGDNGTYFGSFKIESFQKKLKNS